MFPERWTKVAGAYVYPCILKIITRLLIILHTIIWIIVRVYCKGIIRGKVSLWLVQMQYIFPYNLISCDRKLNAEIRSRSCLYLGKASHKPFLNLNNNYRSSRHTPPRYRAVTFQFIDNSPNNKREFWLGNKSINLIKTEFQRPHRKQKQWDLRQ